MSEIDRVAGDTRRITLRLVEGTKPVSLTGWSDFKMIVDPGEAPTSAASRVMTVQGIVDMASGRVGFPQAGSVPPGKYYYQMRGTDPAGETITFKHGVYRVRPRIPD